MNFRRNNLHAYGLMFIATLITVAIVTSSQLVTARIGLLLDAQASELIAADLVISSPRELDTGIIGAAREQGLAIARSVTLRTAVFDDEGPVLVSLKAVDDAYPLRGRLEIADELAGERRHTDAIPEAGSAWVDTKLAAMLGQRLQLGEKAFETTRLLTFEPDRGGAIFNLAPRVMINLVDLEATRLVLPGSRVGYQLMFAGSPRSIAEFRDWIKPQLQSDQQIQDIETARPEMRRALERTRKFFALAIVLTLIIAMAAIAITARYTANREAPKVAMLRAFGVSQRNLLRYYFAQLGGLWLGASAAGMLLGFATQFPLQWALDGWFGKELPQLWGPGPFVVAAITGALALAGFSLPYLVNAIATPPMQVLRAAVGRRSWLRGLVVAISAVVAVFAVLMLLMQSSLLAVATLALILAFALLLPVLLGFMIRLLLFSSQRRFWLRQYLLSRLRASSRGALYVMSGFSLVLIAILLISVVKDELIGDWQQQLPADIPNFFLVNIAANDVDGMVEFLAERGIETSAPYALVRGRMAQINGTDVEQIEFADPRAHSSVNHTFNITWARRLPDQNRIVEGDWFEPDSALSQFSLEEGMARRLDLKLGDRLTLNVGSEEISAPVTSIRSVVWENFKPNFYLIANAALLEDMPQTWLLSALIGDEAKPELKELLRRYPSVTLLDISELMARIRVIIDRASAALQFYFVFALASALIVLLAAIQTGRREREIESSLLRALAASGRQLYRVHVLEFTVMGALIGFFAAAFATAAGWGLSRWFFDMAFQPSASVWLFSLVSSCLVLTVAGILVSRRVYNTTPMKILRS